MATDQHLKPNPKGEHQPNENSTDGACLSGHCQPEFKAISCSYRWQGKQEDRPKHLDVYKNYPLAHEKQKLAARGIKGDRVATYRRESKRSKKPNLADEFYDWTLRLPTHAGDWDLDGPKRDGAPGAPSPAAKPRPGEEIIPNHQNFTRFTWPYWANAHHIIPQAYFQKAIGEERIKDGDIRELIRVGLLRAKYNINHFTNVIYLPMDKEVGKVLQLPRHLSLNGGSEEPDPRGYCDHPRYTKKVDGGVTPVVDDFVQTATSARSGATQCEALKVIKLAKKKLEKVSERCFDAIVSVGKKKPGQPLVDIPDIES